MSFQSCTKERETDLTNLPVPDVQLSSEDIRYLSADENFNAAFVEILNMLDGKLELDFKRAAFLTENAYLHGTLNYQEFCYNIDAIGEKLTHFIKEKGIESYHTSGNYALFEFFTRPSALNGDLAYTYNFDDFYGEKDYTATFVSTLLKTHKGNCHSLPFLYKILANEINTAASLAFAPNHIYIKHLDEENHWVNIELTNGHFSSDAWMISSTGISAEAIRTGIYMQALNERQSVACCLFDLAMAYQNLYGDDAFVKMCCEKNVQYDPTNISPRLQLHNMLVMQYEEIKKNKSISADTIAKYKNVIATSQLKLEELGFRETENWNYADWVKEMPENNNL